MYKLKDPEIRQKMAALTAGMFGIMVASYGNEVFGTPPTGILIYVSMALMLNAQHFDQNIPETPVKYDPLIPLKENSH